MKIKEIKWMNWINDSIDVLVTLENDASYLREVATLQFLSDLMEKVGSYFVPAGYPYIIVSKLTDEMILAAIQEFIDAEEDSYWLKLYHITATLKIEEINEILDRKEKENMELEAAIEGEPRIINSSIESVFDPAFHHRLKKHFAVNSSYKFGLSRICLRKVNKIKKTFPNPVIFIVFMLQ